MNPVTEYQGIDEARDKETALLLIEYMIFLCNKYWTAEWVDSLEYALWKMALISKENVITWKLTGYEMVFLKQMAEDAGGWWMWSGDGISNNHVFVPLEEWKKHYASIAALNDDWRIAYAESFRERPYLNKKKEGKNV